MERYIEQLCEDYKGQYKEADLPYGESEKARREFDQNENCGKPIGKYRLQAFPRATLCRTCKEAEERF